jgi:hypothetical protein
VVLLAPLATPADLDDRNITVPDGMFAPAILASASTAVRDAAGCPISQTTSTVTLIADDRCGIDLPGVPVTAVASVAVEGVTVAASTLTNGCWSAGWRLSGDRLLFRDVRMVEPATITVTYTHGLAVVPADIVDLVCGMVSIAAAAGADYGLGSRSKSIRLGDYAETTETPAGTESPSPMALPERTRERLRARFGGSAVLIRTR